MATTTLDWQLDVDRGPAWLLVKPRPPQAVAGAGANLAPLVWNLLEKHFTYRLVLDMSDVVRLSSQLIGELISLHKRIHQHGGVFRLCGLSAACQEAWELCRLGTRLPNYRNREEAVLGPRPTQPR